MPVLSQSDFDDLLSQKAIAPDGKALTRISYNGQRYPEGEVFTVEAAKPEKTEPAIADPVPKKPPNREVKRETNPVNG